MEESTAKYYSEKSAPQNKDAFELLEKVSPKQGSHVLDVGSGTGYLANLLAERVGPGGKVTAVDPDSARIKVATETYGGRSNLVFAVGGDSDFPEGEYDLVTCTSVMHWIKDKDALFKRVFRNLKPGGQFAFTTPEYRPYPKAFTDIIEAFDQETVDATIGKWHRVSAADFERLAVSNGFEVKSIEVDMQVHNFPTIESFIDSCYAVFHGKFDRSSPLLDGVKKKYKGQEIRYEYPFATAILTKPE